MREKLVSTPVKRNVHHQGCEENIEDLSASMMPAGLWALEDNVSNERKALDLLICLQYFGLLS